MNASPQVVIRPMVPADFDRVVDELSGILGDREFTRATFSTLLACGSCQPLVAVIQRRFVGVAAASRHGQVGWLGHMVVRPDHRGQGIGSRLAAESVDLLRSAGCGTVLLVATAMGLPVYRRRGFVVDGWYRIFGGEPALSGPGGLRALGRADLMAAAALDRQATEEDRSALLQVLGIHGWVERDATGVPLGYCLLARWGGGPVVALNAKTGISLLRRLLVAQGAGTRTLRVPAGNATACRHLASIGMREVGRMPRMRLGPRIAWKPRFVWTVASFAVG